MATQTEKDQIEAFNNWWKENGTFVIVAVIIFLASYFGWSTWQKHQQTQAAEASALFQQILDKTKGKAGDNSGATVASLAEQLKNNYPDTYYGQAVHLLLAEDAVKSGNLDLAEKELTALVQKKPADVLAFAARLRLARVLFAEGKNDAALAQLTGKVSDAYASLFAELQGDVLVAQNQPDAAKDAYVRALNALSEGSDDQKKILEMKMNNLVAVKK